MNKLYNGQIVLKNDINGFVNLSKYELSNHEIEFLNLGLNYHIQPKYCKLHKETEIEMLYSKLMELEKANVIEINSRIIDQLAAESQKHRNTQYKCSIPFHLREAAKNLKLNDDVIIRRADKSSIYVLMDKREYSLDFGIRKFFIFTLYFA